MTIILFFFNDTATTEIYTLSLHDALPISHEYEVTGRRRPILIPQESEGRIHQFPPEQSGHGSGHHQQGPAQTNLGPNARGGYLDSGKCGLNLVWKTRTALELPDPGHREITS